MTVHFIKVRPFKEWVSPESHILVATRDFDCIPFFHKGMKVFINKERYTVGDTIWIDTDEPAYYVQINRK